MNSAIAASFSTGAPITKSGIDMALHDLVGKALGVPLYRLFGLDPTATPRTSFTLDIDEIPVMLTKLEEAREYPILKIKVGVEGDDLLVLAAEFAGHGVEGRGQLADLIIAVDRTAGLQIAVREAPDHPGQLVDSHDHPMDHQVG